DEPRAERVVRLGAEWSQAVDEKGRTDAEALLAEIEARAEAPACVALAQWRGSARWDELAVLRLVRGALLAEERRGPEGYPDSLGDDAPEDPFAPGTKVSYAPSNERRAYRLASVGLAQPLLAHESAPRIGASLLVASPLPEGAVAAIDSEARSAIAGVAFTPDGSLVVASGLSIRVVEPSSGVLRARVAVSGARGLALIAPSGEVVLAESRGVSFWDLATLEEKNDLDLGASVEAFALAPGGGALAVSGETLRLVARSGAMRELARPPAPLRALAFSPDGKALAVALESEVRIFELETLSTRSEIAAREPITALAWSRDGALMAAGSAQGRIHVLDAASRAEIASFAAHAGSVTALAFSPDGKLLVSGGSDGLAL